MQVLESLGELWKVMEKEERCCGNCRYADYYKRRGGVVITTWVDCEVYTTKKERLCKPCHNWKEKKDG